MDKIFPINPSWPRVKFNSSLLSEGAYDPKTETMYIYFETNNSLYKYFPVKKDKFDKMADSPSAGAYFTKHFKNNKSIKFQKVN